MQELFITGFASGQLVQAICRTLIHSLWQGLLAAVLVGIVILSTKRSKAAIRYNLFALLFAGFVATVIITFLSQPGVLNTNVDQQPGTNIIAATGTLSIVVGEDLWLQRTGIENVYKTIIYYADQYAGIITGTWLLFFLFQLLRMSTGLQYAYRIRTQQVIGADDEWKERLGEMATMIGVRKTVSLMESAIVKVPVVTGMLKPMILVPLGMLSNLSSQQVETILLHELAHVRRRDFLVNLLQRFTECIFFFNPFVDWISSRIREEREACCDDIVLDHTTDKRSYLEALISFREMAAPAYSHAITLGSNNNLLYRVKRMITQENKKLNAMEKLTLILLLTAGTAFSFMPAGHGGKSDEKQVRSGQQLKPASQREPLPVILTSPPKQVTALKHPKDTVPREVLKFPNISSVSNDDGKTKGVAVTTKASNGNTYSYRIENGEIIELAVNGEKIRKDDFYKYQPIVDQIEIVRSQENQTAWLKLQIDANKLNREELMLNNKLLLLQSTDHGDMLKKMPGDASEQLKLQSDNKHPLLALKDRALNDQLKLESENKLRLLAEHDQANLLKNKILLNNQQSDIGQLLAKQEHATRQLLESKNQLLVAQDEQFHDSNYQLSRMIEDLAERNLFEDKNHLSFRLDNEELVVDGKKQSSDLHELFRKKYIHNKKDHYIYKASPNSRSTDVWVE